MNSVVIIGCGFVGATAYQAFSQIPGWEVFAYDKFADKCKLKQETPDAKFVENMGSLGDFDLALICLPTPMDKETGECRVELVEEVAVFIRLSNGLSKRSVQTEIVIKSTVPPGTTKRLNEKCNGGIFFNPEFLTEANAYDDFVDLPYQIIGSPEEERSVFLAKLYRDAAKAGVVKGGNMILECDSTMAEMVKLTRNCYLATRLSFFNEIKQICDKLGVNYDDMRPLVGMDERVGSHYNRIPGPDGKAGFGGSCLCKDINDLMYVAKELGVDPKTMRGVWEKNLEVRPERDWEDLKGRAVTEKSENK